MTVILTDLNNKGVEFIQVFCSLARRESRFDRKADYVVRRSFGENLMPSEESFCIGIHDEDGIFAGVQKNGVRGFRANAVEREQLLPEFLDLAGGS